MLMKLEFSQRIFEESSNINFHLNPSSGSRVVPCGWRDKHDEANSHFSRNSGVEVQLHALLTSALDEGKWLSRPVRFIRGKEHPVSILYRGSRNRSRHRNEKKTYAPAKNRTSVLRLSSRRLSQYTR
jgi:hypothetical protein